MEPVLASQLAPMDTSATSATSSASPQTSDEIRDTSSRRASSEEDA